MRKFDTADPLRRGGQRRRPMARPPQAAQPVRQPEQLQAQPGQVSAGYVPGAPAAAPGGVPGGVPGSVPIGHMGLGQVPGVSGPMGGSMYQSQSPVGAGPQPASGASVAHEEWKEFPLTACTSQELQDNRYHIVKFQSRQKVDIEKQFTPPIRFQRKDPKNLQITVGEELEEEEKDRKSNPFYRKRKTHQVMGGTDEQGESVRKLRQEEHYPWVMEDFDGNNAWVSSYEAAQSDTYCVFVFDKFGFKMIPVEKWYKMQSRNKFATLSLDQAEERMQNKGSGHSRWIMDRLQAENGVSGRGAQTVRRMRTVEGSEERERGEEMDYEEEFADDEEAPLIEGPEEELKDVQERIKKEQLQATHPSMAGDDMDDLFGDDDQEIDKQGKKLRKYLRSHEKNSQYDESDDENPYASQSEDDSEPEIKQEPDAQEPRGSSAPVLSIFRKKTIKNLPAGMSVIQLPAALLEKFPVGEWNPHAKRRDLGNSVPSPTSRSSVSPPLSAASASASPAPPAAASSSQYSQVNTSDPTLLTSEDVRAAFTSQQIAIPDLIKALRGKLSQNRTNKDRLKVILREVAHLQEGNMLLLT